MGWDALRAERYQRMVSMELIDGAWPLTPRDPRVSPWKLAAYSQWEKRRMAVYAAQVERMDRGVGSILSAIKEMGIEQNTLILFLSDNGGNYEELPVGIRGLFIPNETRDGRLVRAGNNPTVLPGSDDTYESYGIPWANVSNTPFKLYKHFAHEGGISTPLIAYWPGIIQKGGLTNQVGHVMDVMPTCLEVAGVPYPMTHANRQIAPLEGRSLLPVFRGQQRDAETPIYWEHEGNRAIRQGRWKEVAVTSGSFFSTSNSWRRISCCSRRSSNSKGDFR